MRFATDATLGKLGRQLRAAGFDTLCQHQSNHEDFFNAIDAQRVILTRTLAIVKRFQHRRLLFVRVNDPMQQMIQVVGELDLRRNDMNPFSRCLACNMDIVRVDRETVRGRVPEYVWQHHRIFHRCNNCQQLFWAGSHRKRLADRLQAITNRKKNKS